MDFAPDGRLFFTEKGGNVQVMDVETGEIEPVISLPTDSSVERGMLGQPAQ